MTLNYQPTIWERIGGPWSITLRAYLWTAPIAVLLQPIIEPGFWAGENPLTWIAVCLIGYLTFGAFLFLANRFLIPNRESKPASIIMVLLIAILGGIIRSTVIGIAIPMFGLTGIGAVERMPFGATITVFWIITTALIMDSKYRYRKQLSELLVEQQSRLEVQKQYLNNFTGVIPDFEKSEIDRANYQLQNVFRDLAVKASTSGAKWESVARQVYRAVTDLIFVNRQPRRVSELPESEFLASPKEAFRVISRTPLFNIPAVILFYATSIFLTAARIVPIKEAALPLTIGLLVNLLILVTSKKAIQRSKRDSAFGYINMILILTLLAIIGPTFSYATYISVFELQVFALAGTFIEVIWIVATGLLQLSQLNRQKIINQATVENELLRLEIEYWETISQQVASADHSPTFALSLAESDLRQFLELDRPSECQGAIEFANSLTAEIKDIRQSMDLFSIESEFERIVSTWGQEANILWTVVGAGSSELVARRAIAAIEISILKSLRYGQASLISIDLVGSPSGVQVTMTDNGQPYGTAGAAIGTEILTELTGGTYRVKRAGALTIANATFS